MNLQKIVGPHQPHEAVLPLNIRQPGQGVRRILCTQPRFGVTDMNARIGGGDLLGGSEPFLIGRHPIRRLQRVLRRHQPPHLVQAQQLQRLLTYIQVSVVGRIERPAQQADAAVLVTQNRLLRGRLAGGGLGHITTNDIGQRGNHLLRFAGDTVGGAVDFL